MSVCTSGVRPEDQAELGGLRLCGTFGMFLRREPCSVLTREMKRGEEKMRGRASVFGVGGSKGKTTEGENFDSWRGMRERKLSI